MIGKDAHTQFFPWYEGSALVLAERGNYTRLWLVTGDREPAAVSPENVEVFRAEPNLALDAVALIGSNIVQSDKSGTRQLIVITQVDKAWESHTLEEGSILLPKWFNGGWLAYAHDGRGDQQWTIVARDAFDQTAEFSAVGGHRALKSFRRRNAAGVPYTVLIGNIDANPTSALIYVQGPHRQLTVGAQDTFFHQWLFTSVLTASQTQMAVVGLNGPGSIGLGSTTRDPSLAYGTLIESVADTIELVINDLGRMGVDRIGIMCGSLAAFSVIQTLVRTRRKLACCFVSGVLNPHYGLDSVWSNLLGMIDCSALSLHSIAAGSKLLFIHGEKDEFFPLADCLQFIRALPVGVETQLSIVSGEGHIFRNPSSWEQIASESVDFFRKCLVRECDGG
jgi:hypothetical protein